MVLAQAHLYRRQFDEAKAEAAHVVSARPSCPASFAIKADVLTHLGDSRDAIEHAQHAFRLSPIHPQIFPAVLATAYHGAGRYKESMAAAKGAIELGPTKIDSYLILAACAAVLGQAEEAQRVVREVLALKPGFSLAVFASSQPYKDQEHLDRLVDQLKTAGLE
jgi:adenylate cyclase